MQLGFLRDGTWVTRERAAIVAGSVLGLSALAGFALSMGWIATDAGHQQPGTDFVSFYAAGKAVLEGAPAAPYDPTLHHQHEQAIFGDATPFYSWQYPPFFLLLATPLALLPYTLALLVWQGGALALYLAAIAATVRETRAEEKVDGLWWLLAAGFPAVLINLGHGQNGTLTAGLLGLGLLWLRQRPYLAGVLLGLLSYKPQLALMVPIALAAGNHWRALASSATTVVVLVVLVVLVFGSDVVAAFLDSLAFTRSELMDAGGPGWAKLQTAFAWIRLWGGPAALAYWIQGVVTISCAAAVAWLWHRRAVFAWQAAALCVATVLAAPFALDYDMTVLAIAIVWLAVDGIQRGFTPWLKTALALLWLTPLVARPAALLAHLPLGFFATLAMFAFVIWNAPAERK
jgi:hypothetical protein